MSEDGEEFLEGTFSKRELELIKNALVKLVFDQNPNAEIKVTPLEKRTLEKIQGMLFMIDIPSGKEVSDE